MKGWGFAWLLLLLLLASSLSAREAWPDVVALDSLDAPISQLDAGISGSWFDPAKNFQGFTIQYLSAQSLLLTWFTYDTTGRQAWLQGVGSIQGTRVVFDAMNRFRGPRFGPDFDPDALQFVPAGSLTLDFFSCSAGRAVYSGGGGLPADTLEIERLSELAGYACESAAVPGPSGTLHRAISGAWYDRGQTGQGWMIEMLSSDQALVYWFTYDSQGEQAWMISVADVIGNTLFAGETLRPVGGRFGPNYDPDDVVLENWGPFALSFVGCNKTVGRYIGPTGFGDGFYNNIEALAPINGDDFCAFPGGLKTVDGGLEAVPFSYVDGDTNDSNASEQPNNTPAQAQTIGNPAIVSGFATKSTTTDGRFQSRTDGIDAFRMPLVAGQTLQLIMGDWLADDPSRNDLDLLLYRASDPSQPLKTAESISRNEFLTIDESDVYDIVVTAFNGGSTYTLIASYTPVPAGASQLSMLDDMEAADIVVGFEDGAMPPGLADKTRAKMQLAELRGLELVLDAAVGPSLFRISDSTVSETFLELQGESARHPALDAGYGLGQLEAKGRVALIKMIKQLAGEAGIAYAEPNGRMHLLNASNDPLLGQQWHYPSINLFQAWDITRGSAEVVVAVIDSGVIQHADLEANVRRDLGIDTAAWTSFFHRPSPIPGSDVTSNFGFHGTHVAGTVAAVGNNGRQVSGVAPAVGIMPIQVFREQGASNVDVANGIYWAAGVSRGPVPAPSRRADVINMSLGGLGPCPAALQEAINFARSRGIIVVVAAGNDTDSRLFAPASCQGVVNVSALNRSLQPAYYSNCGQTIRVSAPGGETAPSFNGGQNFSPLNGFGCRSDPGTSASLLDGVLSTIGPSDGTVAYAGTSMAAPHVAGVAALMKSVLPNLSPAQFDAELAAGRLTRDLGPSGWDSRYGFGLIDARRAVDAAQAIGGGGSTPLSLVASPSELNFGSMLTTQRFTVSKTGSGSTTLETFDTSVPWITGVSLINVNSENFGELEVAISREGLVNGDHRGSLQLNSSSGAFVELSVALQVGSTPTQGEAGFMYLLVYDAFTGAIVTALAGEGAGGRYSFTVSDLVSGDYQLLATSDMNFDRGVVCGASEFCATFPGTGRPEPLIIDQASINVGVLPIFPDISTVGTTSTLSTGPHSIHAAPASLLDNPETPEAWTGLQPNQATPAGRLQ